MGIKHCSFYILSLARKYSLLASRFSTFLKFILGIFGDGSSLGLGEGKIPKHQRGRWRMLGAGDCHKIIFGRWIWDWRWRWFGNSREQSGSNWKSPIILEGLPAPSGTRLFSNTQLLTGILCSCKGNPVGITLQPLLGFSQPQNAGKRGSAGVGQAGMKAAAAGQSLWG